MPHAQALGQHRSAFRHGHDLGAVPLKGLHPIRQNAKKRVCGALFCAGHFA